MIPENSYTSPPWGRNTKLVVAVCTLILIAVVVRSFSGLIQQIVGAAIIAYLLNPVITLLDRRTPLKRSQAILVVYLLLLTGIVAGLVALGVAAYGQVNNLILAFPDIVIGVTAFIERLAAQQWALGPLELSFGQIDWSNVGEQIVNLVQPILSQGGNVLGQVAGGTVTVVVQFLFIFVVSIYLANDFPILGDVVARVAQTPGYRQDAERLIAHFGRIWRAYLRGQIILGLVIGFVVWLCLTIIGVRDALALGLLSGLLEFLPVIGPFIGTLTAIIVALFQPDNWLGLTSGQFALLVLVVMLLIQQLENSILVPRIVGDALDLHALTVMIGVIMGTSVAGILGAVLAAPVVATLKLVGLYAWRKMFDLPPFPDPLPESPPDNRRFSRQVQVWFRRLRQRLSPPVDHPPEA